MFHLFAVSELKIEPFRVYHTLWGNSVPPGEPFYRVKGHQIAH